jgi:hypothetical protein
VLCLCLDLCVCVCLPTCNSHKFAFGAVLVLDLSDGTSGTGDKFRGHLDIPERLDLSAYTRDGLPVSFRLATEVVHRGRVSLHDH